MDIYIACVVIMMVGWAMTGQYFCIVCWDTCDRLSYVLWIFRHRVFVYGWLIVLWVMYISVSCVGIPIVRIYVSHVGIMMLCIYVSCVGRCVASISVSRVELWLVCWNICYEYFCIVC